MKKWFGILILIIVCLAVSSYTYSRFAESSIIESNLRAGNSTGAPPYAGTICTYTVVAHEGTREGTTYLFGSGALVNLSDTYKGQTVSYHILLRDPSGSATVWVDGSNVGKTYPPGSQYRPFSYSDERIESIECSPWWLPQSSLLQVPASLEIDSFR